MPRYSRCLTTWVYPRRMSGSTTSADSLRIKQTGENRKKLGLLTFSEAQKGCSGNLNYSNNYYIAVSNPQTPAVRAEEVCLNILSVSIPVQCRRLLLCVRRVAISGVP